MHYRTEAPIRELILASIYLGPSMYNFIALAYVLYVSLSVCPENPNSSHTTPDRSNFETCSTQPRRQITIDWFSSILHNSQALGNRNADCRISTSVTRHRRLLDIVGYSTSSVTQHRRLLIIVNLVNNRNKDTNFRQSRITRPRP
jgi:hypothetical protein